MKGKIWSTINMTNSFFQTKMHPDDVHLTAVNMPFGLYEWLVMPMGLWNTPAIHQQRVTAALHGLIGRICHIYLDDIIIQLLSLQEHEEHVWLIFKALWDAKLYVNKKKTKLFQTEINFLGHKISTWGVEADEKKVDVILNWPQPKSATEVQAFIGLVRYISVFPPKLSDHTSRFADLITKDSDKCFPPWSEDHQLAFEAIKPLVISRECVTFSPYFTFTPPYFLYDYLIPLVQGHMAIHAALSWLISLSMTHRLYYYIWLISIMTHTLAI